MVFPLLRRFSTPTLASLLIATLGLSLAGAGQAQACSCYYPPGFGYADHFEAAQEVLVAKVLLSFQGGDKVYYALEPKVDSKGCLANKGKVIWVETPTTGAECGVELEWQEHYLVHLNYKTERGTYPLELCTFHKKLDELSPEVRQHLFSQDPKCGELPAWSF